MYFFPIRTIGNFHLISNIFLDLFSIFIFIFLNLLLYFDNNKNGLESPFKIIFITYLFYFILLFIKQTSIKYQNFIEKSFKHISIGAFRVFVFKELCKLTSIFSVYSVIRVDTNECINTVFEPSKNYQNNCHIYINNTQELLLLLVPFSVLTFYL